jgi:hypothetical protein
MKKIITQFAFLLISINLFAQQDSIKSKLNLSGYLETYYCFDFNKPVDHDREYAYAFNRTNEININIGFIKVSYENDATRANLVLMTGTYANANLASEPGLLKMIYEANVGVKIHKRKNLWIDAGVFSSHIGVESAVGKDCWNLTRSMAAENSPYYETGAKITYISDNSKWLVSGLVLNGWQHIQRPDGNNTPAVGHQITYTSKKFSINSSSFVENDKPDSLRQIRYFHDLYGKFELSKKLDLIIGFDIGVEHKVKNSDQYNTWTSSYLLARYKLFKKWNIAIRGEHYFDNNGVIIYTGITSGFKTVGYSINVDRQIGQNVLCRIEYRELISKDKVFNGDRSNNAFISTSLAVSF